MLYALKGRIVAKDTGWAALDVGGVVYEVTLPLRVALKLPPLGEEATLFTVMVGGGENPVSLFGFLSSDERTLFLKLIRVMGVGPKTALALFSRLEYGEILSAVEGKNGELLSSVPGIGKKTAGRIILELGGKLSSLGALPLAGGFEDALGALTTLGFRRGEGEKALRWVVKEKGNLSLDEMIREALGYLGRVKG